MGKEEEEKCKNKWPCVGITTDSLKQTGFLYGIFNFCKKNIKIYTIFEQYDVTSLNIELNLGNRLQERLLIDDGFASRFGFGTHEDCCCLLEYIDL